MLPRNYAKIARLILSLIRPSGDSCKLGSNEVWGLKSFAFLVADNFGNRPYLWRDIPKNYRKQKNKKQRKTRNTVFPSINHYWTHFSARVWAYYSIESDAAIA